MRLIIIVLLLAFFPYGILKSQSEKNIWLEKVDPKLLEKVDLNKIPDAPNKSNSNGNRDGEWVIWLSKSHDETSNPDFIYLYRKLKYNNGVVKGKVEDYYLDGTLSATGEIENDKFDGEVTYYNTDGTKQKVENFKNGKLNGNWINYNDKEKLAVKGAFKDGKRTGKWEGFHENGTKKFIGEYTDGLKNYNWTYWDDKNKIENMKLYIRDVEVSPKEAVVIIDKMISNNEIEEAKKMTSNYKEVITWKIGEESTEFVDGLFLDSKLYISQNDDANAIETLKRLIDKKKVSDFSYHSSLINLSKLYKKAGKFDKSIEVLNKALAKVEAGKSVLPFERTLVTDELAEIYLQQKDYTNLGQVIQKANLDEWSKLMRDKDGMLEVIKKYYNDNSINDYNYINRDVVIIFDTRVTDLAYKDILLSEANNVDKNGIIQKVVQLYNLQSFTVNTDSFLKQFNPRNEAVIFDKSIIEALIKKYDIVFR